MKKLFLSILLLGLSCYLTGCAAKQNPNALLEAGLLDFNLNMVQGAKPQAGKPLVLEFWATWCGPCLQLFPHLNKLHKDLQNSDIQFVAVTNEPFNFTREFVQAHQLAYPIAVDLPDAYAQALQVTYIPFAVILNADGKLVWSGHSGKLSRERIEQALAKSDP